MPFLIPACRKTLQLGTFATRMRSDCLCHVVPCRTDFKYKLHHANSTGRFMAFGGRMNENLWGIVPNLCLTRLFAFARANSLWATAAARVCECIGKVRHTNSLHIVTARELNWMPEFKVANMLHMLGRESAGERFTKSIDSRFTCPVGKSN